MERKRGRSIDIDAQGSVIVKNPDGTTIRISSIVEKSGEQQRVLPDKAADAIQALMPIKRRILSPDESAVDQDSHFMKLDEAVPRRYANIDDPREIFRSACATLGALGYSSSEVAEIMLDSDQQLQTSLQFGSKTQDSYQVGKRRLTGELKKFYPANFSRSDVGPSR